MAASIDMINNPRDLRIDAALVIVLAACLLAQAVMIPLLLAHA